MSAGLNSGSGSVSSPLGGETAPERVVVTSLKSDGVAYQTRHFFVGFEYPRKPSNTARVYLTGDHFANVFQFQVDDPPDHDLPWHFNRDALALELGCPSISPQPSIQGLLAMLEEWYALIIDEPCKSAELRSAHWAQPQAMSQGGQGAPGNTRLLWLL